MALRDGWVCVSERIKRGHDLGLEKDSYQCRCRQRSSCLTKRPMASSGRRLTSSVNNEFKLDCFVP